MIGLVLCGGQSIRMGTDKGLMQTNKTTWAEIAAQKISIVLSPVFISIRPAQMATYSAYFKQEKLTVDDVRLNEMGGPLAGILSAHLQHPQQDLLVMACDMINMQTEVLEHLKKQFLSTTCQAMVFANATFPEPLCGIYSSAGLATIYELFAQNKLPKHSMMNVLTLLNAKMLPYNEAWKNCFANFNHKDLL